MPFILKVEELKLKHFRKEYGEMSVDECIELAQQADNYLRDMNAFDIAWSKFKRDSRTFWQYAWLLSCERGGMCPSDPHVENRMFLVAFPRKQVYVNHCEFSEWFRAKEETDIVMEFSAYLPVYLRPDEISEYAKAVFHKQNDVDGRLQNMEIEELNYKEDV